MRPLQATVLGVALLGGCAPMPAGSPSSAVATPPQAATEAGPGPRVTAYFVESGVPRVFLFTTSLNPDCSQNEPPRVTVVVAPEHGRVEVVPAREFPFYGKDNPRSACNTKRAKGFRISYAPDPGYVGYDRFMFRTLEHTTGTVRDFSYTVLVRPPGAVAAPAASAPRT